MTVTIIDQSRQGLKAKSMVLCRTGTRGERRRCRCDGEGSRLCPTSSNTIPGIGLPSLRDSWMSSLINVMEMWAEKGSPIRVAGRFMTPKVVLLLMATSLVWPFAARRSRIGTQRYPMLVGDELRAGWSSDCTTGAALPAYCGPW